MKKESPNPESITRIDVWSKGHTKKDGTASNQTVSETLEKIREYRESVASSQGVGYDALSKVLRPEHCGRARGLGCGVTPSKLGAASENKAHVTQLREEVGTLKEQVAMQNELIRKLLAAVTVQVQQGVSNVDLSTFIPDVSALLDTTRNIDVSKGRRHTNMLGRKCKLMNWGVAEELVAIGRWDTDELDTMVHSTRLGENASRVWVDDVINGCAPLWRITSFMETMQDVKGTTIAWPNNFIIFDDEKYLIT